MSDSPSLPAIRERAKRKLPHVQLRYPLRPDLFGPGGAYEDHIHACPFCEFRTAIAGCLEGHFTSAAECDRMRLMADLEALLSLVTDLQERMQVTQSENRRIHDHTEFLEGCLQVETGAVARLQGEREELRAALINVAETCEDDGVSRCWCDSGHRAQMREESAIPHRAFCLAARAALGEE